MDDLRELCSAKMKVETVDGQRSQMQWKDWNRLAASLLIRWKRAHVRMMLEPNPEMSSFVFREKLMTQLLLCDNAYAQIIRNSKGEVVALYPLKPNRMTVDRDSQGQLYYSYQMSNSDAPTMPGGTVILKPSDVLHVPGLGSDGLVGYNPIAMAKNAIGLDIATEGFGAKFFANGATPGGLLEYPRTLLLDLNAFAELEDKFGSLDQAFQKMQQGSMKATRTLLWAGLLHEDENLIERHVGAMISLTNVEKDHGADHRSADRRSTGGHR